MKLEKISKFSCNIILDNNDNCNEFFSIISNDENIRYNMYSGKWNIDISYIKEFQNKYGEDIEVVTKEKMVIAKYSKMINLIGKNMKLQPYLYQKESIYFCLNNINSLMILPCGAGNLDRKYKRYINLPS